MEKVLIEYFSINKYVMYLRLEIRVAWEFFFDFKYLLIVFAVLNIIFI